MRRASSRKPLPCPPYATSAAPFPDEALRPTIARRSLYLVSITEADHGFHPTDLYVRRFWSAVLGVGAITDLLRIVQAGVRGNSLRRPLHLSTLLTAGLIHLDGQVILVQDRIPSLPAEAVRGLPAALRQAHEKWVSASSKNAPGRQRQGDHLADHKTDRHPRVRGAAPKRHRTQSKDQAANPRSGQLAG